MEEDAADDWPLPKYNPGKRHHLHALGVISVTHASFESSIEQLYAFHPRRLKMPEALIDRYYVSLNEETRIAAIRDVFDTYERDPNVSAAVHNVLKYFEWSRRTRNTLLHAEHYPAMFGGKPDRLHLTKRLHRKSPASGYMALSLDRLRSIADDMRDGIVRSAEIQIHLRVRDEPVQKLEASLRIFKQCPSNALKIPKELNLTQKP